MGDSLNMQEEGLVSAFRDYLHLLEAISYDQADKLDYEKTYPKELLEALGATLKSKSKGLEIFDKVERLVELTEGVAEEVPLVLPRSTALKQEVLINDCLNHIDEFKDYFESKGLTLFTGIANFGDFSVLEFRLGRASKLKLLGLDTTIFIDSAPENIDDAYLNDTSAVGGVDKNGAYYEFDLARKFGRKIFSELRIDKAKEEKSALDKLEELAYVSLLNDAGGDEKTFSKEYATLRIANEHIHEVHHTEVAHCFGDNKAEREVLEAGAELYSMFRGSNVFHGLRRLYKWKDNLNETYSKAAELALAYMKQVGYGEHLWNDIGPDSPAFEKVESTIREQAGKALEMLEKYHELRSHETAEKELKLDSVKYHEMFDTLAKAVS